MLELRISHNKVFLITVTFFALLFSSCATWYQRSADFQTAISKGEFTQAEKILQKDKKQEKGKNRILYYLNLGYVEFMLDQPEKSNQAFETAEQLTEEQRRNALTEAAVLVSNPTVRPYRPEDFEVVMINFYKAMNYLRMDNMEDALVEVRRMNIRLLQLNDKYPDHKNRYQQDAFAHLMMGLIYDAAGDANNAFIAYRNAYNVYQTDYLKNFGIGAPEQLKKDLLRTAYTSGMRSELAEYEKTFGTQYSPVTDNRQMIFLWLNGLGPVKAEWGITFAKEKRGNGAIVFQNSELGLVFPFFWGSGFSDNDRNSIADMKILRVMFPKYMERRPAYTQGTLTYNGTPYPLQIAEDINQIAFKTLHDRMVRELANSLLRLAVKQGIQHAASQQNEWLGFAVGIANAISEKADTRNWQTLPYSVSYARIPLNQSADEVELTLSGPKVPKDSRSLKIPSDKKGTLFYVYSTL